MTRLTGPTAVPLLVALVALVALSAGGCRGTASVQRDEPDLSPSTSSTSSLSPSAPSSAGSSSKSASTQAGCGMLPDREIVGLLGPAVDATRHGTLRGLRREHAPVRCRNVVPGHPERYVTIRAQYHPTPFQLPTRACSEGWVYAGTPEKFTPACQDTVDGHGRTQLIVRWQPYLMHVTIGRSDHDWAGDPERALTISRQLAQRLGVEEATATG